ncbi:hypothetical protein RKLH11_3912 [Rhodobacteraceae bacterium KLH11]|nr:hypothetical protein RKLH11_3912 [Rhodobacteraceae bacterium KLH11]
MARISRLWRFLQVTPARYVCHRRWRSGYVAVVAAGTASASALKALQADGYKRDGMG